MKGSGLNAAEKEFADRQVKMANNITYFHEFKEDSFSKFAEYVVSKLDQKKRPLAANTGSKQKADVIKKGAAPLHEISQSLSNIDDVLNEYNKFKVGHNWILPGTETGYIDSKIATFVLENKQVMAKCYYDHPLLCYVVDLTNEDLLQNCQSPISRLTNVQRLFERKLLTSMKRLPTIYSRLDVQQEKMIDEILEEMQSGLFNSKSQRSELGWIVKYLFEEFTILWKKRRYDGLIEPNDIINEALWTAEPIHIIITAITRSLNKILPQWSAEVCNSTKNSVMKTVDYDSYKNGENLSNDSITQRKPDVWAITDIDGIRYEVMYCEISGMPFKPDPIHIEEDKRKLFRMGVRGKLLFNKNIVEQYGHALTNHLIQSISLLPIPLLRFYKRKFQLMFIDRPGKLCRATAVAPIDIPVQNSQKHKFKAFATRICEVYLVLKNINDEIEMIEKEIDRNEADDGNVTPLSGSTLLPLSISKSP
ncbi:hypothetical protein C2G38_2244695 [Gigaspora rosea]|uniref:Uncharacterized protein n=1 Tax=Gigaspora rosea TaxID=44941 RepID=A0A397VGV7_9GLOM|nr:hypothetical protein C2G38_2244695 [Gigaspora rosea]